MKEFAKTYLEISTVKNKPSSVKAKECLLRMRILPHVGHLRLDQVTYTGLRHEDVRTLRFDHIDWDEHTLRLPDPKGGEAKAFTIPLSKTPYAILERRKIDNAKDLTRDHEGWVFPGIDQEDKVGPVAELRQSMTTRKNGKRVIEGRFPVEDVHSLRRTWESIANDEGITELDQHVLSNHSFGSHNVNATYISQHIDHLAACAEKIDAGIKRRIDGRQPTKRKTKSRHLRSVV